MVEKEQGGFISSGGLGWRGAGMAGRRYIHGLGRHGNENGEVWGVASFNIVNPRIRTDAPQF